MNSIDAASVRQVPESAPYSHSIINGTCKPLARIEFWLFRKSSGCFLSILERWQHASRPRALERQGVLAAFGQGKATRYHLALEDWGPSPPE